MLLEIKTEISINSSPVKLWNVLLDFEKYPEWNPFVKSIKGEKKIGGKLIVELGGMKFKPTIMVFKKEEELTWLGKIGFSGIFEGRHSFKLVENKDGTTQFIQSEIFKGLLVSLLKNKLMGETKNGFEAMNISLKNRVEY